MMVTTGARFLFAGLRPWHLIFEFVLIERFGLVAQVLDQNRGRVLIEHLIDGRHGANLHQCLDHLGGLDRHLLRELGDCGCFRDTDFVTSARWAVQSRACPKGITLTLRPRLLLALAALSLETCSS